MIQINLAADRFLWKALLVAGLLLASCAAPPHIPVATTPPESASLPNPPTTLEPAGEPLGIAPTQPLAAVIPSTTPLTPVTGETGADGPVRSEQVLIYQWPDSTLLSPELFEEIAVGAPELDFVCEYEYPSDWPDPDGEIILALYYQIPVRPNYVNLLQRENGTGIRRVELLNSVSGLGALLLDEGQQVKREKWEEDPCIEQTNLPATSDFEVDTIFISFERMADVFDLEGVELVGHIEGYADLPPFWRITVLHDPWEDPDGRFPGGMATDNLDTLYVANGRHGLLRYDVEGNLLKSYNIPENSYLSDVAIDSQQNMMMADSVYGWFILRSPEGGQLKVGGENFTWNNPKAVALSPIDQNIYLLNVDDKTAKIRVYSYENVEWIRDIPLEVTEEYGYKGLAFDPQGFLYTLDVSESLIMKIDPLTGEYLQSVGYELLRRNSLADLDIDEDGNFYVLMNSSVDDTAMIILDSQGNLLHRLGKLMYDGTVGPDGFFTLPVSLAVTDNGSFLFIRENDFLTAYWLEPLK